MNQPFILLVDDDPDDLLLIKEAIIAESDIFRFREAADGRHALNFLRALSAKEQHPGLIVLDINMPVLDGRETLAILKSDAKFKEIPVIIFTTSTHPADKEYCRQFDVQLLTKPFGMAQLSEAAKTIIASIQNNGSQGDKDK